MDISCAFATALAAPDHIARAEALGYRRAWCTVLDEGEDVTSPRVLDAVGAALAVAYHHTYAQDAAAVDGLPGGAAWRAEIERLPERSRHLAVHAGHLVHANERDRPVVDQMAPLATALSLTGRPEAIPDRIADLAAAGLTEIAYQPMGSDIPRELEAFAAATAQIS